MEQARLVLRDVGYTVSIRFLTSARVNAKVAYLLLAFVLLD